MEKMNHLRNGNMIQRWAGRQLDSNPVTKLVTRGSDNATEVRNAKTALSNAQERLDNSGSLPEEQQRLLRQEVRDAQKRYGEINTASTTPNRFMKDREADPETSYKNDGTVRTSWTGNIKTYQPIAAAIGELNLDHGTNGSTWTPVFNAALTAAWVFDLLFLIGYLNAGEISGNSDNILANLAKDLLKVVMILFGGAYLLIMPLNLIAIW